MLYYTGSNFVLFRSCLRAKDFPLFGWQTRKLEASTNQQWSLWLYSKHLMDMFTRFWIKRPSTFGKYSIFHPLQEYFFKAWKTIYSLICVPYFFFRDVYLSLLFNFKIGPSLGLSCLILSMFIMILIIRIINTTCFDNTISMVELEGKLPSRSWSLFALTSTILVTFTRGLACTFRKVWSTSTLKNYYRHYMLGFLVFFTGKQYMKTPMKVSM